MFYCYSQCGFLWKTLALKNKILQNPCRSTFFHYFCMSSPEKPCKWEGGGKYTYGKRRLLDALSLTHWNLAVSNSLSKTKQRLTPIRCVYLMLFGVWSFWLDVKGVNDIHIGVGFDVARSYRLGDARASMRGTSDKRTPTLFMYIHCCNFG